QYAEQLEKRAEVQEWLNQASRDPGAAFDNAIVIPLARLREPPAERRLIVVDGVDEVPAAHSGVPDIGGLLASRAGRLPKWIRVLVSCRTGAPVLGRLQETFHALPLKADAEENLQDIRQYLRKAFHAGPPAALRMASANVEQAIRLIVDRCGGMFIYAK